MIDLKGVKKKTKNDKKIIYSININDIQDVAEEVIERRLNKVEIGLVENSIGEYIDWFQAIEHAIQKHIPDWNWCHKAIDVSLSNFWTLLIVYTMEKWMKDGTQFVPLYRRGGGLQLSSLKIAKQKQPTTPSGVKPSSLRNLLCLAARLLV